jgi:hypothetical protein
MSSNSSTRSTRKLPSGILYNDHVFFKNKGLVYKLLSLVILIDALKLNKKTPVQPLFNNKKRLFGNKNIFNYGKNYGRVFTKTSNENSKIHNRVLPKRIVKDLLPSEEIYEKLKTVFNPDKLGWFLFNLKNKVKIPEPEFIEMVDKIRDKYLIDTSRTFHTVVGNPTGIEPVHSMINKLSYNDNSVSCYHRVFFHCKVHTTQY